MKTSRSRALLFSGAPTVVMAFAAATVLFGGLLAISGHDPLAVLWVLVKGSFGSWPALAESAVKGTAILLCALAVGLPGRVGLVNIGGEGQFLAGAVFASYVPLWLPPRSAGVTLLTMVLAAMLGGAIWGLVPGGLRAFARTSEIVVSLLLNYVANLGLLYLIHGPWRDPGSLGWAQTRAFPATAMLPRVPDTRLTMIVVIAIALAVALALLARATIWGFAARVIEASPDAAAYVGIRAPLYYFVAFALGGAVAGLAGFGQVAGVDGRLREGISLGYGYAGFLVAWLCRNRFGWMPVAAFLLGGLLSGGDSLQVTFGLPYATVQVLEGLVFLAILTVGAGQSRLKRFHRQGEELGRDVV